MELSWQEFVDIRADSISYHLTVSISTDDGSTWSTVHEAENTTEFVRQNIDVSAHAGSNLLLRFAFKSWYTDEYEGCFIDDIRLDGTALEQIQYPWITIGGDRLGTPTADDSLAATLTLDPSGLTPGLHEGSIRILTNDSRASVIDVPVRFTVALPDPQLVVSTTDLTVDEGGSADFSVSLTEGPAAPITVTVAQTGGDDDLSVSSGTSLTFTSTNWYTPQTVTIAAALDADLIDGTATFTLSGGAMEAVAVTATEHDTTLPAVRRIRIGTDDAAQIFEIVDPVSAPTATPDGGDSLFEELEPATTHRLAPVPGGSG